MKKILLQLIILLTATTGWQLTTLTHIFSPILLPTPTAVLYAFINLFARKIIIADLLATSYRLLISLTIGIAVGLIIGIALGLSTKIQETLNFWIDFLRSVPMPALIPLCLIFFGIGDLAKIILVAFVVSLIIAVNMIYGLNNIHQTRLMVAKTMRLKKHTIFWRVTLPESLPHLTVGIRLAISFALIAIIVAEMIMGAEKGIGKRIIDFQLVYDTANMYASIILIGIIGYLLNKLYLLLERKKLHWVGK